MHHVFCADGIIARTHESVTDSALSALSHLKFTLINTTLLVSRVGGTPIPNTYANHFTTHAYFIYFVGML